MVIYLQSPQCGRIRPEIVIKLRLEPGLESTARLKTVTESAQFLVLSEPSLQKLNKNMDKLHQLL